jgi:hypothetical protein
MFVTKHLLQTTDGNPYVSSVGVAGVFTLCVLVCLIPACLLVTNQKLSTPLPYFFALTLRILDFGCKDFLGYKPYPVL